MIGIYGKGHPKGRVSSSIKDFNNGEAQPTIYSAHILFFLNNFYKPYFFLSLFQVLLVCLFFLLLLNIYIQSGPKGGLVFLKKITVCFRLMSPLLLVCCLFVTFKLTYGLVVR